MKLYKETNGVRKALCEINHNKPELVLLHAIALADKSGLAYEIGEQSVTITYKDGIISTYSVAP